MRLRDRLLVALVPALGMLTMLVVAGGLVPLRNCC